MHEYIPNYLPEEVYKRTVSVYRDYERISEELAMIKNYERSSPPADGQPRSTKISDPTSSAVIAMNSSRADLLEKQVKAVEESVQNLKPREVFIIRQNVLYRVPYYHINTEFSISTMKRIKYKFIRDLAQRLGEI